MAERSVVVRIRAEIGDFRRQMNQAAASTTEMGQAARAAGQTTSTAMTQTQASAAAARAALNEAGKAAQEAAKGFGLSYNSAGQLTDQFGNMVTEAHAAEMGLDTASEATREFAAQQQNAAAVAGEATTTMGRLAASARDHEESWSKAGGALLTFGASVVAGVGLAIAKYAEFDKAMSEVRAATHETTANMDLLREAAISAGADTSYSAKEAADAISELSKAGVTTKDILGGGLAGALSLAAAGSLGVADAAELAATAMVQFKLSGKDIPHIADLLSAGAGKAQGSVEDMGMALKQGGLVAAATGLSIEETTGGLAAFASAGLIGSDAGTSFKTMLQALTPSSVAAKNEMDRLGISAYDSKGNFIGLSKFAGVLQNALKGVSVEQRAASQKIIFGSDAVRASNVLYEQGAEGIADWTAKVNDSGYAASTALIKQDNLAGSLEKLGGSFDSVLIKGGGGAATSLRGLVQGAEGLIDALGNVKPELLSMSVGMAGIVGVTALLGGGFLTLIPKVIAARAAFRTLAASNPPLAAGLGTVGKAAGIAMVAILALQTVGAIFTKTQTKSVEEYANAIMKVSAAGSNAKSSDLDSVFQGFTKLGDIDYVQVGNLADSVHRLTNPDDSDGITKAWEPLTDFLNLPKGEISQLEARFKGLGDVLGDLTSNGGAASAAKTFNLLTKEFEKNGQGAQQALDKMPGYKDALLKLGHASGVALEPSELLVLAAGRIPARMEAAQKSTEGQAKAAEFAAAANEEAAKKLDEMGLAADGTILSLSKLLDLMFASGLIQLSANEAAIKWQESLEGMNETFKKYGNNLDITTEGGKANQRALDGMAAAGIANAKAMADNGATQEELQGNLHGTYDALIAAYDKFGITGTAADDMARQVLGIPKDVPIDTSIQNFADTMAKAQAIKKAVDDINTNKTIFFRTDASGFYDPSAGTDGKGAGSGGADRVTPKAYANGGINGAFATPHVFAANGLHRQSMIARGGANITWAEPETGWEAYISGKPGQEARNRGILQTIAPRFGLEAVPSKSMAGGYGQARSFSGNGNGGVGGAGGSSVTFAPQITVNGAADTGAVVQEVWGKFQFEAQKAGLRIGG